MINYIKAEILKQKRSFNHVILWLLPVINIAIAFLLMGANYIQTASYNWWYILFLPFSFTFISSSVIQKEKKYNFHGLFGVVQDKKVLWYAKIGMATIYLLCTCLLFSLLTILCGLLFHEQISVMDNILAGLSLFITFAWQIPLFMFITLKWNMFLSIIVSLLCNLVIACLLADGGLWWIPFSIPARIMCPIIKVLPNGLLLSPEHVLNDNKVIFPGVLITVALYFIFSKVTSNNFKDQEV